MLDYTVFFIFSDVLLYFSHILVHFSTFEVSYKKCAIEIHCDYYYYYLCDLSCLAFVTLCDWLYCSLTVVLAPGFLIR